MKVPRDVNIYWRRNAAACDLGRAEIFSLFFFFNFRKGRNKKYGGKNAKDLKVKGNFFQEISVAVNVTLLKK